MFFLYELLPHRYCIAYRSVELACKTQRPVLSIEYTFRIGMYQIKFLKYDPNRNRNRIV